jgi:glutamate dehydrogenase
VDCSDHEVNIKVLLDRVVADGDLTVKQRDQLLNSMTGEVATLLLRDHIEQTRALANAKAEAASMIDVHARCIRALEQQGKLDRSLERLPSGEQIEERIATGRGLVTPELAVLLAYTKILAYEDLRASDPPDDPLGNLLRLDGLRDKITALPRPDRWQTLARQALCDDL